MPVLGYSSHCHAPTPAIKTITQPRAKVHRCGPGSTGLDDWQLPTHCPPLAANQSFLPWPPSFSCSFAHLLQGCLVDGCLVDRWLAVLLISCAPPHTTYSNALPRTLSEHASSSWPLQMSQGFLFQPFLINNSLPTHPPPLPPLVKALNALSWVASQLWL